MTRRRWIVRCLVRDAIAILVVVLLLVIALRWLGTKTAQDIAFAAIDTQRNGRSSMNSTTDVFEVDGQLSYVPPDGLTPNPVGKISCQYVSLALGDFLSPVIEEHSIRVLYAQSNVAAFSNDDVLSFAQRAGVPVTSEIATRLAAATGRRDRSESAAPHPTLELVKPNATGVIRHTDRLWRYVRARWAGWFMLLGLIAGGSAAWLCFPRSLIAYYRIQSCRCPRCSYTGDRRVICPECGLRPSASATLAPH